MRGTGEVRLGIELPGPGDPRQVLVETASGELLDCRDPGLRAHGPGWLVAADGTVSVGALADDWRRILVVTRSGRIASVESVEMPTAGRVRARWLPDIELEPLDVAAYARVHGVRSVLLEFVIRLESTTGVEKWVWPDYFEADDAAAAPLWHKWAPLGCEYRFGAQSDDRVLPEPRVAPR